MAKIFCQGKNASSRRAVSNCQNGKTVCVCYTIIEYLGSEGISVIGDFHFLQFFLCLNLHNFYLMSSIRKLRGKIFINEAVLHLWNSKLLGKISFSTVTAMKKITLMRNKKQTGGHKTEHYKFSETKEVIKMLLLWYRNII